MRLLLVEDDDMLGQAVRDHLIFGGHATDWVRRLGSAEIALRTTRYDVILLDLNLPDGRGLELLRALRRRGSVTPVIILTAHDQLSMRIDGLNAGADDYLVKPFDLGELTARIGAVGRRYAGNPNPLLAIGPLELDIAHRVVTVEGRPVELSAREWAVLERLAQHPGTLVSKAQIEDALFGFGDEVESNAVEVYVSRLRRKLAVSVVHTVRGARLPLGSGMSAPSITRRLILTLTIGAVVLWVLAALFTIVVLRNEQQQTLDGGLRETAERILPLAIDALRGDRDGNVDGRVDYAPPVGDGGRQEQVVYQVRQADGRVLMRSFDAPQVGLSASLVEGFSTHSPWRIYTMSDLRTGLFIQLAESEERREATLFGSALSMLLPLVLLVPLGTLGIALAVQNGLAPLRRVGDEIARRDAANLAPLDIGDAPVELKPMTASIDDLLQRLRAAFEAERTLAANSAHELRTPIAGSLAQTQRLVEELTGHPAEERARRVEQSLHRLAALAGKLLALSRAESGSARTATRSDLLPALKLLVEDVGIHESDRVILDARGSTAFIAAVDLDAFGIMMRNLLENALLHGSASELVVVTLRDEHTIEVTNAGPHIPHEALAGLTRRFVRGNTAAPGSGVGLTIVETIMRQVGGRLELLSPGVGREDGFTARLIFAADAASSLGQDTGGQHR